MAAMVGEEGPCTFCPEMGRVIEVVGDLAVTICEPCEVRVMRMWAAVEAQEARQQERLRRKKERALVGAAAS